MAGRRRRLDYFDELVNEALVSGAAVTQASSNVVRIPAVGNSTVRVGNVLGLLANQFGGGGGGADRRDDDVPPAGSIEAAVLLAVMDFNERYSPFSDSLGNLPYCDFYLTCAFRDSRLSPIEAGRQWQEEFLATAASGSSGRGNNNNNNNNAALHSTMAVVGPTKSAESTIVGTMGGAVSNGIPNISPASTAQELDDRVLYPYFARTANTNRLDAEALCIYLNSIGVRRLAVLHTKDSHGVSYMMGLRTSCSAKFGMRLVVVSVVEGVEGSMENAVSQLAKANATYHVGVYSGAYYSEDLTPFVYALHNQSLIGVPDKVWFFSNGFQMVTIDGQVADPLVLRLLNRTNTIYVAPPEKNMQIMRGRLESFFRDAELMEYFLSRVKSGTLAGYNYSRFRAEYLDFKLGSLHDLLLSYDAALALGVAACQSQQEFFTGSELYESLKGIHFQGASGDVLLDSLTATRSSANFTIANILSDPEEPQRLRQVKSIFVDVGRENVSVYSPIVFSDGTTLPLQSIPPAAVDMNLASLSGRIFCWALGFFVLSFAAFCAVWTVVNRRRTAVRASQPLFLVLLAVGSFVLGGTIFTATFQEPMPQKLLDVKCMLDVWLGNIGFSTAFVALFSKTTRIYQIVKQASRCRRVEVRVKDVLRPFLVMITMVVAVLTVWTVLDPFTWSRVPLTRDEYGRVTSSKGSCLVPEDITRTQMICWLLLLAMSFSTLLISNYQSYRARNLPTHFNESFHLAITNLAILESLIIGLPIMLVVRDDHTTFVVVLCSVAAFSCAAILIPIFVPKFSLRLTGPTEARFLRNKSSLSWTPRRSRLNPEFLQGQSCATDDIQYHAQQGRPTGSAYFGTCPSERGWSCSGHFRSTCPSERGCSSSGQLRSFNT